MNLLKSLATGLVLTAFAVAFLTGVAVLGAAGSAFSAAAFLPLALGSGAASSEAAAPGSFRVWPAVRR